MIAVTVTSNESNIGMDVKNASLSSPDRILTSIITDNTSIVKSNESIYIADKCGLLAKLYLHPHT